MFFTILMMIGLLFAVANDVKDPGKYISDRNKQHSGGNIPINKNEEEKKDENTD